MLSLRVSQVPCNFNKIYEFSGVSMELAMSSDLKILVMGWVDDLKSILVIHEAR